MARPVPGAAGFTLLEMLAVVALAGLVFAILTQGTRFGLAAWLAEERALARHGDMDAADRGLRRLIERLDPEGEGQMPPFTGLGDRASFISEMPEAAGMVAGRARIGIGVDAAHRLVVRWQAAPHAVPLAPMPAGQADLLDGVQRLELSYLGPSGWTAAWSARVPPIAVRMRVVFPPGDARHWPDIVAGPLRARPPA